MEEWEILREIESLDSVQAGRFKRLKGAALEIAVEGISRHMKACRKNLINPDVAAIREIIDDALQGKRIFAETNSDLNFIGNRW